MTRSLEIPRTLEFLLKYKIKNNQLINNTVYIKTNCQPWIYIYICIYVKISLKLHCSHSHFSVKIWRAKGSQQRVHQFGLRPTLRYTKAITHRISYPSWAPVRVEHSPGEPLGVVSFFGFEVLSINPLQSIPFPFKPIPSIFLSSGNFPASWTSDHTIHFLPCPNYSLHHWTF